MAKNDKLAKRSNTGISKWQDELAKHAQETADKEQMPKGSFVSTRGGILSIAGSPMKDNKVQVVILDHVYENVFYGGDYDADNPQPPACYAFARADDELEPHKEASEPVHDQCAGCPNNEFGSAEKGKGKACKNSRRLAMVSADGLSADSVADGDVVYFKLPVTSTKGWAYYVKGLNATLKRPPFGVITEVSLVPDPKSQFKVTFNHVGNVPDEAMDAVMERRGKVMEEIMFPYGKASEATPKAAPKGKASRRAGKF